MVASIVMIVLAFAWLMYETRFLTIRLESYEYQRQQLARQQAEVITDTILEPHAVKVEPEPIRLITQYCERTRLQREWAELSKGSKYRHSDTWVYGTGYNTRRPESYQVMVIGKQAITLIATLPNLYEIIAECVKAQTEKPRKASVTAKSFQPNLIEQVRVGSHHEYTKWNHETSEMEYSSKPKRGYIHQVKEDYTTVYHDCLVPKEWLQEHEHDLDGYEPTIELSVNGKTLSVNGDYKKGIISEFVKVNK